MKIKIPELWLEAHLKKARPPGKVTVARLACFPKGKAQFETTL